MSLSFHLFSRTAFLFGVTAFYFFRVFCANFDLCMTSMRFCNIGKCISELRLWCTSKIKQLVKLLSLWIEEEHGREENVIVPHQSLPPRAGPGPGRPRVHPIKPKPSKLVKQQLPVKVRPLLGALTSKIIHSFITSFPFFWSDLI